LESGYFEWDDRKAEQNRRKHRVTFEEAATAFEDELAIDAADEAHSGLEERRVLIGLSQRLRLLTVVYTERHEKKRLITARRSTKAETARYAEQAGGA
jgi:uncharacterized protein